MQIKKRYYHLFGGLAALAIFLFTQASVYADSFIGRTVELQADSVNVSGLIIAAVILGSMLVIGVVLGRRRLLDSKTDKK